MKSSYCTFLLCILGGLLVGGFSACSKSSEVGLSLVEQEVSNINRTDSIPISVTTVNAQRTLTSSFDNILCGAYNDPVFGKVSATGFLNFSLASTNADFSNAVFDSIVLVMAFQDYGHYGSAVNGAQNTAQSWGVYRLNEMIQENESYYSDDTLAYSDKINYAGNYTFVPAVNDSVAVNGINVAPHVRIRLSDALGQELMNPANTGYYASNVTFKQAFNGLVIVPEGLSNDALVRFKSSSSYTKIVLYYHDAANTAKTFEFPTNNDVESFSSFAHDYSNLTILDNNQADTNVYIQGLQGVEAKVDLSGLDVLNNTYINKAELILTVNSSSSQSSYEEPVQLFVKALTSAGDMTYVQDLLPLLLTANTDLDFFGGQPSFSETGSKVYKFRVTEQLQSIVNGETPDSSLYITSAFSLDPERVQLLNQNAKSNFAKIVVTYTK